MRINIKSMPFRWVFLALIMALLMPFIFYWLVRWQCFGPIPSVDELRHIRNYNASEVIASQGELLGRYFIYDRTSVSLNDISDPIIDALVATEDVRFYRHGGIDIRSLGRVLIKNVIMGQAGAGGGSTITMQLAKNLYPRNNRGKIGVLADKLREAIIARRLERVYQKDELMLLYLNTVPFGDNVFGIAAAAQRFFNKPASDINTEEAAVLIGMLKATTLYNPRLHPDNAQARRNTVISQLNQYGYVDDMAADSLKQLPLVLDYTPITHIHGPAPYFREWIRHQLVELLDKYNQEHETSYNLYTDGLTITTTIDYELQAIAEAAFSRRMASLQTITDQHYRFASRHRLEAMAKRIMPRSDRYISLTNQGKSKEEMMTIFRSPVDMGMFDWSGDTAIRQSPLDSIIMAQKMLHGAMISIEPPTSYIRTWIGGNSFRFFKFDNVLASRQAGSAFKPFVYAAALENDIEPCAYVSNAAIVFLEHDGWSPANADGTYDGYYSMKGALSRSVNTVSVRYLDQVGVDQVIQLARQAGIQSSIPVVPSLALGTLDVSLLELTAAYGIFTSEGRVESPRWLIRIEDADGQIIYEHNENHMAEEILAADHRMLMTEMLRDVAIHGTASALAHTMPSGIQKAGKTGTTQNNADSWFIGYTPGLITGVWVGAENPSFASAFPLPMGASAVAVPIWGDVMRAAYHHDKTRHLVAGEFTPLPPYLAEMMLCEDYLDKLPTPGLFERLFGRPEEKPDKEGETEPRQRRRGLLRRIIDEIF